VAPRGSSQTLYSACDASPSRQSAALGSMLAHWQGRRQASYLVQTGVGFLLRALATADMATLHYEVHYTTALLFLVGVPPRPSTSRSTWFRGVMKCEDAHTQYTAHHRLDGQEPPRPRILDGGATAKAVVDVPGDAQLVIASFGWDGGNKHVPISHLCAGGQSTRLPSMVS
jgi:hypothetical protein